MKSKIYLKVLSFMLSAITILSLSSCDSFKKRFAGNLTDSGISMDSIAAGHVFTPENGECALSPSPYDTVLENSLFVGNAPMSDFFDSLSFWRRESPKLLEKTTFFYNTNFGIYENNYIPASSSSTHPYMGEGEERAKLTIEEAVRKTGVKIVVLCFSVVNDLPIYGDEENCHIKAAADMGKLVLNLKRSFNDISVVVLSSPQISSKATYMKTINNEKIKLYNEELEKVCTSNGGDFIDISALLSNEENALKADFSADNYYKLNQDGCKVLLSALRYYAKERKGEI